MRYQHKTGNRGAFTLIEILVVLVIMGFLIAMVAPKLSGVVGTAVDTACDGNQERLRKVVNATYALKGNLPGGLTNLIVRSADDVGAAVPLASDGDKTNGAEFLSDEFVDRFKPQVHFLDAEEVTELHGMNVSKVNTLARLDAADQSALDALTNASQYEITEANIATPLAAGVPVLMAGVGIDSAGTTANWGAGDTVTVAGSAVTVSDTQITPDAASSTNANADGTFAHISEGKSIGRILLGVSNMGELVQSGILDESGTCPGQIQNADNFTWGNYVIVVPRLQATIDRLTDTGVTNSVTDWTLHAIALEEQEDGSFIIAGRTPATGQKHFTKQEASDFTTSCPEGHTWGSGSENYAVSVK